MISKSFSLHTLLSQPSNFMSLTSIQTITLSFRCLILTCLSLSLIDSSMTISISNLSLLTFMSRHYLVRSDIVIRCLCLAVMRSIFISYFSRSTSLLHQNILLWFIFDLPLVNWESSRFQLRLIDCMKVRCCICLKHFRVEWKVKVWFLAA